ncbi:MAG: alpha-ribazole phosphatase [Anaerolineales bacterium]|nr:alpha-ribazole phosphatase [Chloroflexota bacterium]MBL6982920.1 alpha-ribazole phosphatase [Anaerolineales bacterium]
MLNLLLVRHGETEWNLSQRFQGHSDVPLTNIGQQQAASIARRLADEEIHAIYTSDLSRAWDTAMAISEFHEIDLQSELRLREGNFGQWEGMTYAEIEQSDPEAVKAWHEDLLNFSPPGGETPLQLSRRVTSFYDEIQTKHSDQTLLLVAHGGSLQILICLLLDIPIGKFWQFNLEHCSLSKISIYPEGAIINVLNDTGHLITL